MKKSWKKHKIEDILVDAVIYVFCAIVLFACIYPFYYIFIVSINEGADAARGGIYWLPRKLTMANYERFFNDAKWLKGLLISILRTVIGTFIGVLATTLVAYGLSFKDLKFRKFYVTFFIISMYFSGGIIPYYAVLKELNLINTFAVYVIPGAINTFFLLVGISFFQEIPPSLREAARIDGAKEMTVFRKIILPISMPFVATCILFIGVGHWNNWFDSAIFIHNKDLNTLSFLMMQVINSTQVNALSAQIGANSATTTMSVQAAAMMVSTIPIICSYPFLQKYLISGMMVGAVKE